MNSEDSFFMAKGPHVLCMTRKTSPHPPSPNFSFHSRQLGSSKKFLSNTTLSAICNVYLKVSVLNFTKTSFCCCHFVEK